MINVDMNKIPYTGGKYYDLVEKEEFEKHSVKMDLYELSDIVAGEKIILYRCAKMVDGNVVYQRMVANVMMVIPDYGMTYSHKHTKDTGQVKQMMFTDYKENWYFIKPEDVKEQ